MDFFPFKKKQRELPEHFSSTLPLFQKSVLVGRLEHFSSVDGIQYVLGNRISGILVFQEIQGRLAEFYIQEGHLIRASGIGMNSIGHILKLHGKIDDKILNHALRVQKISEGKTPLGNVLVKLGAIDTQAIREAVILQIQQMISTAIEWKQGLFFFAPVDHRSPDGILLKLTEVVPPGSVRDDLLLLNAVRAKDEAKNKNIPPK